MTNTFKIAKNRGIKLPKYFLTAWQDSRLQVEGARSLAELRKAYSSKDTTDEIRNAIINTVFNPSLNYQPQLKLQRTLGLRLINTRKGKCYLVWKQGLNKWTPKTNLDKQILQASNIPFPFTKMFKSIAQLSTPEQISKTLNAGVFVSGYLGLISNFAWLVRGFIRHNDPDRIIWAYAPDEEETWLYESELRDDTSVLYDVNKLSKGFERVLSDLNNYDWFIELLGEESGIFQQHMKFKEEVTRLIALSQQQGIFTVKDISLINSFRKAQMDKAINSLGDSTFNTIYNFNYSALSVADTAMGAAEAITKIDLADMDVLDKMFRIHGNKLPPRHESEALFTMPVPHVRGSREFFREREAWRKNKILNKG